MQSYFILRRDVTEVKAEVAETEAGPFMSGQPA